MMAEMATATASGVGLDEFESLLASLSGRFINVAPEAVDESLEEALGLVGVFAGADRVSIGQRSPDGTLRRTHQWLSHGGTRPMPEVLTDSYPWSGERVFAHGERIVLAGLEEMPPEAATDRANLESLGIKSLAVFPLPVGGTAIGALALGIHAAPREWPPALVRRLGLIADVFSAVLGRSQAQAALTSYLAFKRLLAETSATFVGAAPDTVDDHILTALARFGELLEIDRSIVTQRDLASRRFQMTHQWVRDDRPEWRAPSMVREQQFPWLSREIGEGRAVVLSRMSELPPEAVREREFVATPAGPKSIAQLPLTVAGEVIGSVTFGSIQRERDWPRDVVERLQLFAQILGNALGRKRADVELRASLAENERLRARLEAENIYLRDEVKTVFDVDEVVGRSPAIRAVLHKVDQVAATGVAVLLLGETGTGKELIARAVHARSGRNARPLIAVNCAALPPTLIESELFGHEKGAFTGATQARAGRFELADGGTLFLDEIGDLEPALQAKLLRALQEGEIQRIGSARVQKVDVRVIAATNRDLDAAMREGRFRSDLYYRLGVFPIEVPALRERREDIPLLVWHFIQSRQRSLGRQITQIADASMDTLVRYDWPGNVREMQNVIDRALILSPGPALRLEEALKIAPRRAARSPAAPETLRDAERAHIIGVLERCAWTLEGRGQAADRLGLRPSTLRNRMRKLDIRRPPGR
jgi:transcriptional regulator with GAF, ATPase, and Fis domain